MKRISTSTAASLALVLLVVGTSLTRSESTNVFRVYERYPPEPSTLAPPAAPNSNSEADYDDDTTSAVTTSASAANSDEISEEYTTQETEVVQEAEGRDTRILGDIKTEEDLRRIEQLTPPGYDASQAPSTNMTVDGSVIVFNIRDINEETRDFNLEINLRLYWKDDRLDHLSPDRQSGRLVLNSKELKDIWTPDVFIDHVKSINQPSIVAPPTSLRVYYGGVFRYSARMTAKLSCRMDFTWYPADTQVCPFEIRSFSYGNDTLRLAWRDYKELVNDFILSSYDVSIPETSQQECTDTRETGTKHSVIRFEIHIRRKMYFHLIQTYLPSLLLMIISWLSFLVPPIPTYVSARMTICMSSLLNLAYMFAGVRQSTPNESYPKALDIWCIACLLSVFITLVEYALVLYWNAKKVKAVKPAKDGGSNTGFFGSIRMNMNFSRLKRSEMTEATTITPVSYSSWYYIDPREYIPYQIRRPKLRKSSIIEGSDPSSSEYSGSPLPPVAPEPLIFKKDNSGADDNNGKCTDMYKKRAQFLEKWAWKVIPGMFLTFCIFYWSIVLYQHYRIPVTDKCT